MAQANRGVVAFFVLTVCPRRGWCCAVGPGLLALSALACGGRIAGADPPFPDPGACTQIAGGAPFLPPNPLGGEPAPATGGTIKPGRYFAETRTSFIGDGGPATVLPVVTATVYEFYDDSTGISRTDYGSPAPQTVWTSFSYTTTSARFDPIDAQCLSSACSLCSDAWTYTADDTTLTLNHTYQDGLFPEEETLVLVRQSPL
jgi:hypothetical protein